MAGWEIFMPENFTLTRFRQLCKNDVIVKQATDQQEGADYLFHGLLSLRYANCPYQSAPIPFLFALTLQHAQKHTS
jgi:hypothetical protein